MKRLPHLLFSTVVVLLTVCGCQGNFEERLKEEAQQYTLNHCPQRLDEVTMLDSVAFAVPTRTYTRYMSIPANAAAIIKNMRDAVKTNLLEELKNDASWKTCKEHGINFCYVYHVAGEALPILSVTLTPTDYAATSSSK